MKSPFPRVSLAWGEMGKVVSALKKIKNKKGGGEGAGEEEVFRQRHPTRSRCAVSIGERGGGGGLLTARLSHGGNVSTTAQNKP